MQRNSAASPKSRCVRIRLPRSASHSARASCWRGCCGAEGAVMTPAERAIPQPGAAPGLPDATASLADLAIDTTGYVRAWSALFASEARVAGISMVRLAVGAIVAPAVALVVCISLDALL